MFKKIVVVVFFLFWVGLAIKPVDPGIWALENLVVVAFFPLVLWLDRRYRFSNGAFLCLTAFVILHLFGAHLTYKNMAYFSWFSELFGFKRNYYDQVIHMLFGLLVYVAFFEVFHHQGVAKKLSYLIAFLFISSVGAWYEVLEWLAMALFCLQPEKLCSEAITQGDVWDTQKDMAYAMLGAAFAFLLHSAWGRKRAGKAVK